MSDIFTNFLTQIVFLHVVCAIIWLGGMIVLRYAVHFSMQEIAEPRIKIERSLQNLNNFFKLLIPSILLLLLSALILIYTLSLNQSTLYSTIILKEVIFTAMAAVFIFVYIKRNQAQKAFEMGEMLKTKNILILISKYLIPLNIFLGFIAVYLGVVLRAI